MHQLVKLTGAILLLQLVISTPFIHALGDPSNDYILMARPITLLVTTIINLYAIIIHLFTLQTCHI